VAKVVLETCRELALSMLNTIESLESIQEAALLEASDHVCAQGKDVWALLTNDVDHEKIHVGQVLEARYESHATQDRLYRVLGEWVTERSRLIASLVGLTDEAFRTETAPGAWSFERIVQHVLALERDSLRSVAAMTLESRPRAGASQ
jgi:hypothetical protein